MTMAEEMLRLRLVWGKHEQLLIVHQTGGNLRHLHQGSLPLSTHEWSFWTEKGNPGEHGKKHLSFITRLILCLALAAVVFRSLSLWLRISQSPHSIHSPLKPVLKARAKVTFANVHMGILGFQRSRSLAQSHSTKGEGQGYSPGHRWSFI